MSNRFHTELEYLLIDPERYSVDEAFGRGAIRLAAEGFNKEWRPKDSLAPPSYTTDWNALPIAH